MCSLKSGSYTIILVYILTCKMSTVSTKTKKIDIGTAKALILKMMVKIFWGLKYFKVLGLV